MKKVIPFLVFVALATNACAAQTAQTELTATAVPSHTPAPTSTSTPAPTSTITLTLTPSLPTYGVIDPNVGEQLKVEGIVFPEELKNPEYDLDPVIELQKTNWAIAYGIPIPITVVPEKGIAYGEHHITGIGATQDGWNAYGEQFIKDMWIHYREFGNPADRDITLEQYVELLKAGRGGFEIPPVQP